MYLNDAFDRGIDARDRPSRPIPSGAADANTVFALGFGFLLGGVAMLLAAACGFGVSPEWAVLAGLALCGAVTA
jgi:4-hydroxybenzoate polyprenyltransferase